MFEIYLRQINTKFTHKFISTLKNTFQKIDA